MSLQERATEYFEIKKYNCCQAVVCAYCDEYGVQDETVFKLAEGFGGGMGGMRETCGAVTGAFMAISIANSAGKKEVPTETKAQTYAYVSELAEAFQKKQGSILCRELKTNRTACIQCVQTAAELVENFL